MEKTNNFNMMRLIFSLMVILSHSYALIGEQDFTLFGIAATGGMAVYCFFTISGYLVTQSYVRNPNIPTFAAHRFLRVAPGLVVTLFISAWLFEYFDRYAGTPSQSPNGPLFTISWEVACYVFVAALGFIGALSTVAFPAFLASVWLVYFTYISDNTESVHTVGAYMMLFAMGAFVAIREKDLNIKRIGVISILVLAAFTIPTTADALLWCFAQVPFIFGPGTAEIKIRTIIFIACAPFALIYIGKYVKAVPFIKSDLSYGIYIFGWPVQKVVSFVALKHGYNLTQPIYLAITLAILIPIAFISWTFIEKPALSLKTFANRAFSGGTVSIRREAQKNSG